MRAATLLVMGFGFFLAGCATPETRLRTGLENAGVPKTQSACMADRMTDKLSFTQLRRLGSLASVRDDDARDDNVQEFLHRVRALGDAEIVSVSISSAALCALN
jgi:hypothetical protein